MTGIVGVKPNTSSILNLKKELLFFDQIHLFEENVYHILADVLIPQNSNLDEVSLIKNLLSEVESLLKNKKTDNKLLKQVFEEYNTLKAGGFIVQASEEQIIKQAVDTSVNFKKKASYGDNRIEEFLKLTHLIAQISDIADSDKDSPKSRFKVEDMFTEPALKFVGDLALAHELRSEIIARYYALVMGWDEKERYMPILDRLSGIKTIQTSSKSTDIGKLNTINAVLNSLPLPNVETPLQEVLDFRNDAEANGHILALNNWMIDVTTKNLSPLEIEQKIEHLLFEYNKFIRIQKLSFSSSKLEIVITTIADIAENLVKFKFSNMAKRAFDLFKTDIRMLEAEMNAPGKEVAYISAARNIFNK